MLSAAYVQTAMSAMPMRISCSLARDIINFWAAEPATTGWLFEVLDVAQVLFVDVGRCVPKLRNARQLVRHRHRWRHQIELPFMAFFKIMSTVSMRLISLVPSKMRLMRASR